MINITITYDWGNLEILAECTDRGSKPEPETGWPGDDPIFGALEILLINNEGDSIEVCTTLVDSIDGLEEAINEACIEQLRNSCGEP